MKKCNICGDNKYVEEFGIDNQRPDGRRNTCKECKNARAREIHSNNPEKAKARNLRKKDKRDAYYNSPKGVLINRRAHLKRSYGITLEEYNTMAEEHNFVCAICSKQETHYRNKVLSVDHCHNTGEVRGLLCSSCNKGIGQFNDDIEALNCAINYLKKYKK
jgi:hypothetical protein